MIGPTTYHMFNIALDVSVAVDEGPILLPTSLVLVVDGHSAMKVLRWTKRRVIVAMATYVCDMFPPMEGVEREGWTSTAGDEVLA